MATVEQAPLDMEKLEAFVFRAVDEVGATLNTAFDRYEYDSAAAILLIIIGIVMVVEYSSGYLRRWVQ